MECVASPPETWALGDGSAFDVALVPWSRSANGYPWLDSLGSLRTHTVIGIDSTTNEAVLWTREIGRRAWIRIWHLLGSQGLIKARHSAGIDSAARLFEPSDALPNDQRTRAFVVWAELMVRTRLADLPSEPVFEGAHVLGWTTSLGRVRELMGAEPEESSDNVRAALERLERQFEPEGLFHLGAGLPIGELEQRILALALAPELDGRFHSAYGYLHNDLNRGYASATLVADLLNGPDVDPLAVWNTLSAEGVIGRYQLLDVEENADGRAGPESPLRVPADLIEFLTRGRITEATLGPGLSLAAYGDAPFPDIGPAAEFRNLIGKSPRRQLVQLVGPRPAGDWACAILSAAGCSPLRVDLSRLDGDQHQELERLAAKVSRVARLAGATPVIEGVPAGGRVLRDLATLALRRLDRVIVDIDHPWTPPAAIESRIIDPFAGTTHVSAESWLAAGRMHRIEISAADAAELAATRRDDPALASSVCRHFAAEFGADAKVDRKKLQAAARALSAPTDTGLVRRFCPVFGWTDIVLPGDRLERLKEIPQHVRHAARVLDDWGYAARLPFGQGVAALFAGPSGTGKTMAAHIIAADLGVEVFQVDLTKTVSKYIGETEKHLNRAFSDAERASAVLLFDEADALFGKRTEVKDAHGRYANVEVAYLLQRLEQFRGVVILTTNFKQNMDAAFVRRLRFIVDFPQPNAEQRLKIWAGAAPKAAPGWSELDFTDLAQRFQLTGGHIQQIALTAAFLAAGEAQRDRARESAREGAAQEDNAPKDEHPDIREKGVDETARI